MTACSTSCTRRSCCSTLGVELQRGYVREFLRVVKPGGLVAFQAVARTIAVPGTHFESPIETPGGTFTIDMNVFPRDDVERTIASAAGACCARCRTKARVTVLKARSTSPPAEAHAEEEDFVRQDTEIACPSEPRFGI